MESGDVRGVRRGFGEYLRVRFKEHTGQAVLCLNV